MQSVDIFIAVTDGEIGACFSVFKELRPLLQEAEFLTQIRRQELHSYQILALRVDGVIQSAAGFRLAEFLAWGKVLYIDDLTTLAGARGKGYAAALLDWLIAHAQSKGCQGVHLDTGYGRHAAHRVYLKKGFELNCHHMALVF